MLTANVCTLRQALDTAFRDCVCFVTEFYTGSHQTFCVHKWPYDVCGDFLKEGMLPKIIWHNSERLSLD